jgi:hypothetical protein
MNFNQTPEFTKEFKALAKKYRSLPSDLEKFQIVIESTAQLEKLHFFDGYRATVLHRCDSCEVIKARLDCENLGNKQLLRVIYMHIVADDSVFFVELYAKSAKNKEDESRIKRYLLPYKGA